MDITKTNLSPIEQFLVGDRQDELRDRLKKVLNNTLTPDMLMGFALKEFRTTPGLKNSTPESFFGALVKAAELGLKPSNTLGHVYLIPFQNRKNNTTECQFVLGYQGMLVLLYRIPEVAKVNARAVYSNDAFEFSYGTNEYLRHIPVLENKGTLKCVYADITLKDGTYKFEVLSKEEIDAIRNNSAGKNAAPWSHHYESMALGKAIRKIFKTLPISDEINAVMADDESVLKLEDSNIVDTTATMVAPVSSMESLEPQQIN